MLFLGIMGCLILGQKLNDRMLEAQQLRDDADFSLSQERQNLLQRRIAVETLRQDTSAILGYLETWGSELRETDDENKARTVVNRVVKQALGSDFIRKQDTSKLEDVKGGGFIPKKYQSALALEGPYIQSMAFLAKLESQLPASRVTSYTISKASRGEGVNFNVTLETPVLNTPAPAADAAAKAPARP